MALRVTRAPASPDSPRVTRPVSISGSVNRMRWSVRGSENSTTSDLGVQPSALTIMRYRPRPGSASENAPWLSARLQSIGSPESLTAVTTAWGMGAPVVCSTRP